MQACSSSVSWARILYEQRKPQVAPGAAAAKTVPLTTPGGALDPRDAWRGKEGAAIEEIKREMTQLTDDMKRLRQEREQRLDEKARERLEQLAALASPPVARPPEREPAPPPAGLQPAPRGAPQAAVMPPGKPPVPGALAGAIPGPGIFKLALVDRDGQRDVLGLWIEQTEGAKFWMKVVNDLRNRGVEDLLIAVVDGLKGFPEAIAAVSRRPRFRPASCT